jgi:5'-AMP-activated protein kinase, catalytic alpha subunit
MLWKERFVILSSFSTSVWQVVIMKTVAHPNVLGLLAFDMELEFERKPVAVLVLELAEGGELFDYLMYSGYFQESIARTYFHQLVSALQTCHANNIYHRDIK